MTHVSVEWRFSIGATEYLVMSSNRFEEKLRAGDWSASVQTQVQKCCGSGGRAKGRILYLLETGLRGLVPVAVLAYHLESKNELEVRAAESALALKDREREFVAALLLCADAILRRQHQRSGAARIVWPVSKGDPGRVRTRYNFRPAGLADDGRTLLARRTRGT